MGSIDGEWKLLSIPRNAKGNYDWNALPEGLYLIEWRTGGKRRREAAAWYDDPDRRRTLVMERQTLDDLAQRLGKRRYDLDDPQDRRAFRGRLPADFKFDRDEANAR